jgi:phosphosulfolactate synthase (CoM biosynthesis protein A)
MDKIQKMVEAYNKTARKWGFDEIEIIDGKISKSFVGKVNMNGGFFKGINILYQNGYMKEDYEKIKNSLPQVTKEKAISFEKPSHVYEEHKHEMTIEEEALANTFRP